MRFEPKTEAEVASGDLWQPGTYDFEISEATEEVSKAGNEMIKLKLLIYNEDGNRRVVFDYLMEKVPYKLRHCAVACGLQNKYESGVLTADDLIGHAGRCKISIRKDKTGQYPDQNQIADYLVEEPRASQKRQSAPVVAADLDDEIPF